MYIIRVGKFFWDGQSYIMSVHNCTRVNSLIGAHSFMCRATIHISVTSHTHTHTHTMSEHVIGDLFLSYKSYSWKEYHSFAAFDIVITHDIVQYMFWSR